MVRIKQLVIKHARGHPHSARFVLPSAWAFGGVSFYTCCLTSHPLPLTLILIFPCRLVCEVVGITPIPQSRPLQSHRPRDRKPWCWRGPGDVDWAARGSAARPTAGRGLARALPWGQAAGQTASDGLCVWARAAFQPPPRGILGPWGHQGGRPRGPVIRVSAQMCLARATARGRPWTPSPLLA